MFVRHILLSCLFICSSAFVNAGDFECSGLHTSDDDLDNILGMHLHMAMSKTLAEKNDGATVKALLTHKPRIVNHKSKPRETTALMMAAAENCPDLIDMLRVAKASLNAIDADGNTSMHYAATKDADSAVRSLLQYGAYADPCNRAGETPLCIAIKRDAVMTFDVLNDRPEINWNMIPHSPLLFALKSKSEQVAKRLTTAGAGLDLADHKGNTPLHIAASKGIVSLVKLLCANGADPRVKNKANKYPKDLTRNLTILALLEESAGACAASSSTSQADQPSPIGSCEIDATSWLSDLLEESSSDGEENPRDLEAAYESDVTLKEPANLSVASPNFSQSTALHPMKDQIPKN